MQLGAFDYPKTAVHPAFNLSLRCNFVDGTSGNTYLKLVGSEGSMDVTWDSVTLKKNNFSDSGDPFLQKQKGWGEEPRKKILPPLVTTYKAEEGYKGGPYDHMVNFLRLSVKAVTRALLKTLFLATAQPHLLCFVTIASGKESRFNGIPLI